ncbi:MAG: hypothetical protein WEA58_10460 [Balneolaceae bacterium]
MEPLESGNYYHIYNRGAGSADLFWNENDFRQFLKKYIYYLYPCLQTFAWCLLHNHFHALVRVRTLDEQAELFNKQRTQFIKGKYHGKLNPANNPFDVSRQISHLMNSYTRYINKKMDRTGTLIEGPLKRKKLIDESNFLYLICYIHRNPIHHQIHNNYTDYSFTSYLDFIGNNKSFVEKKECFEAFWREE